MRKIIIVLPVALLLGGCSVTGSRVLDGITDVLDAVKTSIGLGKSVAMKYCDDVSRALDQVIKIENAVGASCKAKTAVTRVAVGVSSLCNSLDDIDSSSIRTVVDALKKARADAKAAVAAGC